MIKDEFDGSFFLSGLFLGESLFALGEVGAALAIDNPGEDLEFVVRGFVTAGSVEEAKFDQVVAGVDRFGYGRAE